MNRLTDLATKFPASKITLELPKEEYEKLRSELSYHRQYEEKSLTEVTVNNTEFIIKLAP